RMLGGEDTVALLPPRCVRVEVGKWPEFLRHEMPANPPATRDGPSGRHALATGARNITISLTYLTGQSRDVPQGAIEDCRLVHACSPGLRCQSRALTREAHDDKAQPAVALAARGNSLVAEDLRAFTTDAQRRSCGRSLSGYEPQPNNFRSGSQTTCFICRGCATADIKKNAASDRSVLCRHSRAPRHPPFDSHERQPAQCARVVSDGGLHAPPCCASRARLALLFNRSPAASAAGGCGRRGRPGRP